MIIKYEGELGNETVPENFRGVQYYVLGKYTEYVFVLVAVKTTDKSMYTRCAGKQDPKYRLSNIVEEKFHDLISHEIQRRSDMKITHPDDFTAEELDDILEEVHYKVLQHQKENWHLIFYQNGKVKDIRTGLKAGLKAFIKRLLRPDKIKVYIFEYDIKKNGD